MSVRSVAVVAAVLLLGLGSWALVGYIQSDGPDDGQEIHARIDGPVLSSDAHWEGGVEALIRGRLQLIDGCLHFGEPAIIWPTGTTWDEAEGAVRLRDGSLARIGSTVSGGGGALSASEVADGYGRELADAVRACDSGDGATAVVFNPDQDLEIVDPG